jgi:protein gp37
MADKTKIEWTDATWNPVRGCSLVSAGCTNCYAMRVAARFNGAGQPYEGLTIKTTQGPKWSGEIMLLPDALDQPIRWAKPRKIFVNSMSDLFHEDVPFEFIADVFAVMACTTRHTYQILTKRPARMLEFFSWLEEEDENCNGGMSATFGWPEKVDPLKVWPQWTPARHGTGGYDNCGPLWPLVNVWIGVSVEDQKSADERIPLLAQTPAAVRWLSAEPLLGPVDLTKEYLSALLGGRYPFPCLSKEHRTRHLDLIDWVVVGGETGARARPMHPDWVRELRDQCNAANLPFFFKQHGEWLATEFCTDDQVMAFSRRTVYVRPDGSFHDGSDGIDFFGGNEEEATWVGKKAAGRLLDGRTWDQCPPVESWE